MCQLGPDWDKNNCSRKIIGARFYSAGLPDEVLKTDSLSPRDYGGHGTHCASTAAGSAGQAARVNGLAKGGARGGAPHAPWVITVAASKVDRSFPTAITLGNNQHILVSIRV